MPIRIELTDKTKDGEPLYAVQDFLGTQPNTLVTVDEMPAWMRERFSMLLINKEHMFEIDGVGFCYDGTTFYIRGEEALPNEQTSD